MKERYEAVRDGSTQQQHAIQTQNEEDLVVQILYVINVGGLERSFIDLKV